jgi:signal transduction histidine kinase
MNMYKRFIFFGILIFFSGSTAFSGGNPLSSQQKLIQTWLDSAVYFQDSDSKKSLNYYMRIINTEEDRDLSRFTAEREIAKYYYYNKNDVDSALKYSDMALETAQAMNDSIKIAKIYNMLASVSIQLGEYEEAHALLKKAEKIFKNADEKEFLAFVYMNMGSANSSLGNFSLAVDYYNKSRKLYVEQGDKDGEIACLSNLVMIYIQFRQYKIAKKYQLVVYDYYKNSDFIPGILTASTNMGVVYFYLEEYDSALVYFQKVLDISEEVENDYLYSNVLNNIAETLIKQGRLDEAWDKAQRSFELCKDYNDLYGQASALKNLGVIEFKNNNISRARDYLEKSLPLARKSHAIMELQDILLNLSHIYKSTGEHRKALECYEEFTQIRESMNEEEVLFRMEELQYQFERQQSQMDLLEKSATVRKNRQIIYLLIIIIFFMIIITIILSITNRIRKEYYRTLKTKNDIIQKEHALLVRHQDHLSLINKILRHDLANNNTAVMSAVKLYKRQKKDEYLDAIVHKAKSSLELIERMKQLEKITQSPGSLKPVSIRDIIKRVCIKNPTLEYTIEGEGSVYADEALQSVMDNLIQNSVTHGGADHIDVTIKSIELNNIPMMEIRVADNGSGISDSIKSRIFDEEFSFGPRARTGLGLYIVKKNIERYNGYIEVEDNTPEGTIMILRLPKNAPENNSNRSKKKR